VAKSAENRASPAAETTSVEASHPRRSVTSLNPREDRQDNEDEAGRDTSMSCGSGNEMDMARAASAYTPTGERKAAEDPDDTDRREGKQGGVKQMVPHAVDQGKSTR
jgi:hypothetical protein